MTTSRRSVETAAEVVTLKRRSGQGWGFAFEPSAEVLVVLDVLDEGAAASYNKKRSPEEFCLEALDCILAVNTTRRPGEMVEVLSDPTINRIELLVVRATPFCASIRRCEAEVWGLQLTHTSGHTVFVEAVHADSRVHDCDADIEEGDIVVSVNGKHGEAGDLLHEVQSGNEIEFLLLRPRRFESIFGRVAS